MLLIGVAAWAAKNRTGALTQSELKKVQGLVNCEQQAWNAHDATAAAGYFTQDATLIDPMGRHAANATQIRQLFHENFAGPFANATVRFTVEGAHRIGPNEILIDVRQEAIGVAPQGVGGAGAAGGGQAAPVNPEQMSRTVHAAVILREQGGSMRIVAVRAFPEPGMGGAGPGQQRTP